MTGSTIERETDREIGAAGTVGAKGAAAVVVIVTGMPVAVKGIPSDIETETGTRRGGTGTQAGMTAAHEEHAADLLTGVLGAQHTAGSGPRIDETGVGTAVAGMRGMGERRAGAAEMTAVPATNEHMSLRRGMRGAVKHRGTGVEGVPLTERSEQRGPGLRGTREGIGTEGGGWWGAYNSVTAGTVHAHVLRLMASPLIKVMRSQVWLVD